jgi:hypothetical protein
VFRSGKGSSKEGSVRGIKEKIKIEVIGDDWCRDEGVRHKRGSELFLWFSKRMSAFIFVK